MILPGTIVIIERLATVWTFDLDSSSTLLDATPALTIQQEHVEYLRTWWPVYLVMGGPAGRLWYVPRRCLTAASDSPP